ncbi:MAG: ParA family protein [Bacteroidales bacterium]|nr:ParA family protein [Bacteroidales bacterium]
MQVISFFSAKGGTGKSTFNMLLASYLKYVLGKRVMVLDLDAPGYNLTSTREREADGMLQADAAFDMDSLYPIRKVEDLTRSHIRAEIADLKNLEPDYDYVIIDSPGSLVQTDASFQMLAAGVFTMLAIPMDVDGMSIASSYSLGEVCKSLGQPFLLFFNKVYWQEKKDLYAQYEAFFAEGGMKVSGHRIKNSVKLRRDADGAAAYMRSSVCFPIKEIKATVPEIIELFEEVLEYAGRRDTG